MSKTDDFSQRVINYRKRERISQEELAHRLGISRNYVSMIEGGREPSESIRRHFDLLESSPMPPVVREEPATYPRSILRAAREKRGLSPEELAKIAHVPAGFIRKVESGEFRGSNEKELRKLAAALEIDPDELLRGSDHAHVVGEHVSTFGAEPKMALTDKITAKSIPLISMAQAGELVEWEDVYDYEGVFAYAGKDPRAIAVRIRGESMTPDYGPGTIAILYPSHKPQNDNLVVAKTRDGNVLFKRLQIAGGEFIFHSINPKYEPMRYSERDIAWIYPVGLTQKVEL